MVLTLFGSIRNGSRNPSNRREDETSIYSAADNTNGSGSALGHRSNRGHQAHHRPGVSDGSRPPRSAAAERAAAITRSAAWNKSSSWTSSTCHVPPSKKNDATRYGGTPNRSVWSRA